jgi:hypothetical protein
MRLFEGGVAIVMVTTIFSPDGQRAESPPVPYPSMDMAQCKVAAARLEANITRQLAKDGRVGFFARVECKEKN